MTGEPFNHGAGWCTVDAPKAQGVGASCEDRTFALKTVTIESKNDYASILAVALDDKGWAPASRFWSGTTLPPLSLEGEPATFKDPGKTPTRASVTTPARPWNGPDAGGDAVRNSRLKKATALDGNGMPGGGESGDAGAFVVTMPASAPPSG